MSQTRLRAGVVGRGNRVGERGRSRAAAFLTFEKPCVGNDDVGWGSHRFAQAWRNRSTNGVLKSTPSFAPTGHRWGMTPQSGDRTGSLAPRLELSIVAGILLAVTWLMFWVAATHR
jgi:hypothetical protein